MSAGTCSRARRPARFVAILGVLLSGCDLGGPEGPAQVLGIVTGDPQLGAAVIELSWEGVTGIEGRGSTQVYSAPVEGSPSLYRAVLVDAAGGDLRFTIHLADDRLHGPVVIVESAVGTDNLPRTVGELSVVLER